MVFPKAALLVTHFHNRLENVLSIVTAADLTKFIKAVDHYVSLHVLVLSTTELLAVAAKKDVSVSKDSLEI